MISVFADPREERRALLELVADGEHPLELRYLEGRYWHKHFADTPAEADAAAARLTRHADVFVGMLPRLGRDGDAQRQYADARLVWADCDTARACGRLDMFEPTPSAVVLSGGIDNGVPKLHAYWLLTEPLPAAEVKRHTLRLAHYFESDAAVAEPARVMRVPGSRSHKTGRVARLARFTGEAHTLADVTGELPDPPARERTAPPHGKVLIPRGQWHPATASLLGLMRHWGACAEVLDAAALALAEHQFERDGGPIDVEHLHATARDIAARY